MDSQYQPFHRQATDLKYRFHDSLNDPSHPMAHVMAREIHELTQDIAARKDPNAIESRIKVIQHQLIQARAQGNQVLNSDHNQYLHHNYERMRTGLRQLPHY